MLKRSDRACFQEERDVMVKALVHNSPWIAKLHHTFQDEKFLYFLMDFYNGGDMLTMLSKFDDKIPEDIARFYVAEIVLAINSLHQMGYVHRDIKPDNVLLESSGHIVLADFGSCLKLGENGLVKNNTAVGTPDYISPEILRATEDNHGTYGVECDFWSLGVVVYEMLFGETPFYSENLIETYSQIMNFEENFSMPDDCPEVSETARDLIRRLICDRKRRLGRSGLHEFKEHPFFVGIDWDNIRKQTPPYIPEVRSPEDTSNFDIEQSTRNHEGPPLGPIFRGCQVACIGFTFTDGSPLNELGSRSLRKIPDSAPLSIDEAPVVDQSLPIKPPSVEAVNSITTDSTVDQPTNGGESEDSKSLVYLLESRCAEYERRIKLLEEELGSGVNAGEAIDDCTESNALASVQKDLESLRLQCSQLKELNATLQAKSDSLRAELTEQQEANQKLASELRDFEEENETLCKRATDAQNAIRQLDKEHEDLLSDLARLRALLAEHRQFENTEDCLGSDPLIFSKNEHIHFSSTPALLSDSTVENSEIGHVVADNSGVYERLRDTEARLKLLSERLSSSKLEVQSLKLARQSDQREWARQQELMEHQLESALADKTTAFRELTVLKANYAELEASVAVWERRLFELNQWADDEKSAKDKLQRFTCHVVAELEALRSAYLGPEASLKSMQENANYHDLQTVCNGQLNVMTNESFAPCIDSPVASLTGDGTLDWRQRKSTKVNKMERSNLQVALNNEVRAREHTELRLQECEIRLKEVIDLLRIKEAKVEELEQMLEQVNEQLLQVSNQTRLLRMKNGPIDDALSFDPTALNHTGHELSVDDSHRSLQLADMEDAQHSTPAQHPSWDATGSSAPTQPSFSAHNFTLDTFSGPTKCRVCTCLMLGQRLQGVQCQNCGFKCHQRCRQSAPSRCPADLSAIVSNSGFDGSYGFGTSFEGPVQTPKGGVIKRGWIRQFMFLSDMRLFIYDITTEGGLNGSLNSISAPTSVFPWSRMTGLSNSSGNVSSMFCSNSPNRIVDLRSPGFSVSHVTDMDVIHAKRHEIPRILQLILDNRTPSASLFLLFDTVTMCDRWLKAIEDSVKLVQRNLFALPDVECLQTQEVCDISFLLLKQLLCACVLDEYRILVGADDGLHVVDIKHGTIVRRGDKKPVFQVEVLTDELQLVIIIQEKQRRLKLLLLGTIEGMNSEPIKVSDPKSCSLFVCGMSRSNTICLLCAAGRRSVFVYEIARVRGRHRRLREITFPDTVQAVSLVRGGDWLCVGCPSYFALCSLWSDSPHQALLRTDLVDLDASLTFFQQAPYDAYLGIQVDEDEFLLVFENCAVYVNTYRQRTRSDNLMWPSKLIPTNPFAFVWPYLYVFTEIGLIVYQVTTGMWVATLSSRYTRPLCPDAHLCLVQTVLSPLNNTSPSAAPATKFTQPSPSSPTDPSSTGQNAQRLIYLQQPSDSNVSSQLPLSLHSFSASKSRCLGLQDLSTNMGACVRMRKPRRFTLLARDSEPVVLSDASMTTTVSAEWHASSADKPSRNQQGRRHAHIPTRHSQPPTRLARLISGPSDFQHVGHLGPQVSGAFVDLGPAPGEPPPSESERIARFKSVIEEKYRAGNGSPGVDPKSLRTPPIGPLLGLSSHINASSHPPHREQTPPLTAHRSVHPQSSPAAVSTSAPAYPSSSSSYESERP
ncbi:Serine/threonine-protein kinase MRCK beta [Paragonimus heterotremus]|uniref:non-specific serine/threonine protein kinase n=1 Tax=Paragonimus heterotremus TaxID=100268 RepID=A0A8J4WTJ8_9TREM|nr:Serine/threonine-protein kinase MRCK beta [Paragonimus heterotremus]